MHFLLDINLRRGSRLVGGGTHEKQHGRQMYAKQDAKYHNILHIFRSFILQDI